MLEIARKLHRLLEPQDRPKVAILVLLMIATAFVQTAGVASVMPFLAVVADPDMVHTNAWLSGLYNSLNFESTNGFLYFLGIGAFIVFVGGTGLQAFSHWVITRFSHMQQYHLSRRLMGDYLRRPYVFFLKRNSGDLAKTVLQETAQAVNGGLMPALRLLSHILLAGAIVALLIAVQPILAIVVALALGSIYAAVYVMARTWLSRIGQDRVAANRERFTIAQEAFTGAKEIRLLGREHAYLERFREPSRRFARHQADSNLLQMMPQYAIEGVAFGGVLLIVIVLMAAPGGLAHALPLIGLYGLAGKQLIPAFQKIFTSIAALRFNMPAVDNILEDLGDENGSRALLHPNEHPVPLAPDRALSLHNVTYRYPESEAPALDGITLSIPGHTTVGFVGSSGAGKSTLIDVILGLLEPESGEIRIDETPLSPRTLRRWQAAIGYVPQHIFLADQSVAANIALGFPENQIDAAAVERAARLAEIHDFVTEELPEGYATVIGERGVRLSGGQRQRIGIARALYKDPPVLLFDEATSALDNATEQAVMEAIHKFSGSKTILLVAHRLSTVKPCDRIFVFANGKLVESGNWAELSEKKTQYFRQLVGKTG